MAQGIPNLEQDWYQPQVPPLPAFSKPGVPTSLSMGGWVPS